MKDQPIDIYLTALASKTSTPGGGAVAAITGAQLAALISMVCRFTRPPRQALVDEIVEITDRSESARHRFIKLADADVVAFKQVMQAYKLPENTPEDQKKQQTALQQALLAAAKPPLETIELAASLTTDIVRLASIGNLNLITDVGIAALLVPATIQAAQMNVLVNLRDLSDTEFKQQALQKIQIAQETTHRLLSIAAEINKSLLD